MTVAALLGLAAAQAPAPIARRYVMAAVNAHFQQPIDPASVSFFAPLVTPGDPGLVVAGARPDLRRGGVDLDCRATHDPGLPAFTVWVRHPPASPETGTTAAAAPAPAPVLIPPGQIVSLSIQQGTMSLVTQVRLLQPARRGQPAHALSLATHAIVEVEAIAANEVRLANR